MTTVPKASTYAVNENGDMMQDLVMCSILGVDHLPEGYMVDFINGDTLDCRRANLRLVPIHNEPDMPNNAA